MFGFVKGLFSKRETPTPKRGKRSYDAAKFNRLVRSWSADTENINQDLRCGIDTLRSRARDLAKNEPMVSKYLSLVETNIVGSTGFVLQSSVLMDNGKEDGAANDAIEKAWKEFSKTGNCEVSKSMSMSTLQKVIMKGVARDGEALILESFDSSHEFGYSLQLMDINRLATDLNRVKSSNSNAIIMGVEVDSMGRPVNYHLKAQDYGQDNNYHTIPYSAKNIIHLFLPDYSEQVRGASWLAPSMVRMFHLKKYQEWAIIASAVGASKMGFFTTPEGDGTPLADGEDDVGELYSEAEGGQFGVLPEGYSFQSFDPDYPQAMYAEFIKATKRDIASGLNVSYNSLANDLEGVNFSSIRSGVQEEREHWKTAQDWFISSFLERVYGNWLKQALLKGAIRTPRGNSLPASKTKTFLPHTFLGRRWQWVDPLKDVQASVMSIANNLIDPYTIAAQQGLDATDVIDGIARFKAELEAKGISSNPENAPQKPSVKKEEDKEMNDNDEDN